MNFINYEEQAVLVERPISANFSPDFNGQAIVLDTATNTYTTLENATTPDLTQVGLTFSCDVSPNIATKAEEVVVSGGTATLKFAPLTNQLAVKSLADNVVLVAGDPSTNANAYSITGNTITVNSAREGQTLYVVYTYQLTDVMRWYLYGDVPLNKDAIDFLKTVGTIDVGGSTGTKVWLDIYDTTAVFEVGGQVSIGANGKVKAGTGTPVLGTVVKAPDKDDNILVIELNLA